MKTYFDILKESWDERKFQSKTIPVARKFRTLGEGVFAIVKKGSEIWNNDGRSTFKKEERFDDLKVQVDSVDKSKSKANEEIWYMCSVVGHGGRLSKEWKVICSEKDLVPEDDHKANLKDSEYAFIHLTQLLNATGVVNKDMSKISIDYYEVHRNETSFWSDEVHIPGRAMFDMGRVVDFFEEKDANEFAKICNQAVEKMPPATKLVQEKNKPHFSVEKNKKDFTFYEVVEILKKMIPDWTIEKAKNDVRGEAGAKKLGIV